MRSHSTRQPFSMLALSMVIAGVLVVLYGSFTPEDRESPMTIARFLHQMERACCDRVLSPACWHVLTTTLSRALLFQQEEF